MDKISNIIWNVLNQIEKDKLTCLKYYNININYNDIINVWKQFIVIEDLEINKLTLDESSLKISLLDSELSIILERIFYNQIKNYKENIIIIYIKENKKLLLLMKTYQPILKSSKIQLPYWCYFIECDLLKDFFNKLFINNENLIIFGFVS